MKGIILAGGTGTRLHPMTLAVTKQLLPVYDKPMIYYPLSMLMLAGIREILIISTPHDLPRFRRLLGDGARLGPALSLRRAAGARTGWPRPSSSAASSSAASQVALVLGDNIFYGHGLAASLRRAAERGTGATVFAYRVPDPERYGVVEFDGGGRRSRSRKSRKQPQVELGGDRALLLRRRGGRDRRRRSSRRRAASSRSPTSTASISSGRAQRRAHGPRLRLARHRHAGSLIDAAAFVRTLEVRQGLKICCPEEIAFDHGFIGASELEAIAERFGKSAYGRYLRSILAERRDTRR